MRIAAIIALLLSALPAHAQVSRASGAGSIPGLVRAYHFDRSGKGSSNLCDTSIGCPTLGIWFDDAVAATYTTEIGGYVMTVNGNPTRVSGPVWPSGLVTPGYNWRFDGTGDYLSLADDPAFEAQDFSVFMCIRPPAAYAVNDFLFSKLNTTGNQASWGVYSGGAATSISLAVSDDGTQNGGHYSVLSKTTAISPNRLSCFTVAYNYVADGTSVGSIWVDELAVGTASNLDGPPFDSTSDLYVAARASTGYAHADIFVAAYYPGVLTAADHQRLNRRFRGLYDGSGNNPVTVTAATMPAIPLAYPTSGVSPFLIDQPANSNAIGAVASGSGGLYGASAVTNLVQRSSFETWAAGAATGWPETPTGAGDATQNTTLAAHGSSSMQLNCPGAADAITIKGACMTVTGGAVYSLSWYDYLVSGAGALDVAIYEDDSADCGSPTGHTTIGVVPIAATWNKRTSPYTMQAGTIRAQMWATLPAAAAQVALVDALQLKPGIATDAYCDQNVDAPSVCSTMVQSVADNGSLISANGPASIVGTFRTPWVGTAPSGNRIMWSSGAYAGTNTISLINYASTDEPAVLHFDGTTTEKDLFPSVSIWPADTDYLLRARWDGNGALGLWWNAAWNTTTSGAGAAKRTAAQALFYIGCRSVEGYDVWARDLQFYRRFLDYDNPAFVVVGDSIAWNFAPSLVSLYLYAKTINAGVSGNKFADVEARWSADVLARAPFAVLLHVGVNDISGGTPVATMEASMEALAVSCEANGIHLIVDNIGTHTGYDAPKLAALASYNTWLATTFAAAHPTVTLLDYLSWAEDGSGDPTICNAGWFDANCVHPNATGNALWAAAVKAAVPLLW